MCVSHLNNIWQWAAVENSNHSTVPTIQHEPYNSNYRAALSQILIWYSRQCHLQLSGSYSRWPEQYGCYCFSFFGKYEYLEVLIFISLQVHIVYRFEVHQNLKFEVYDIDSSNSNLDHQDFLGVCETTLGQVIVSLIVTWIVSMIPCTHLYSL